MNLEGIKVDQKASFVNFVYPFLFNPEEFLVRTEAFENAQWIGRERPLRIWKQQHFPEDDLLPHVARYLNPSDHTPPTARLWKIEDYTLTSRSGLGGKEEWELVIPQGLVHFRINDVQLTMFRIGVGFLTVQVEPKEDKVSNWLDLIHYFRFARGRRGVGIQAKCKVGKAQSVPFYPEPAGGIAQHPEGKGFFTELIDALLITARLEKESDLWWHEVFIPGQLIPFAALFIDLVTEKEIPSMVYRVRNFFHACQEINPSDEDLRLDHPNLLPYAKYHWFVFSLDGGGFVGCNPLQTDFFRKTLPDHLKDQYFLLFLLALHQRFTLMMLSEEVAKHWLADDYKCNDEDREKAFARIMDAFLSFTARGQFTQVMQQEHHHRCYQKWQEIFQVNSLYQEVSEEVQEMYNYLQMCRTERLQKLAEEQQVQTRKLEERISVLAVCIGIPALILSFMSINLYGFTTKDEGIPIFLALLISVLGGGLLSLIVVRLLKRRT